MEVNMVAALMFIMIALVFYVIYSSVYEEEKEKKEKLNMSMKDED